MSRFTSSDMVKGRQANQPAAPAQPSGERKHKVTVPVGGQVTIRRASNGVVATVTGADYRDQAQIVAERASDLQIE